MQTAIAGGLLVAVVLAVLFLIVLFRSMWRVAGPNEALIVSGMGGGKEGRTFKIVTGGGTLVIPGMQIASRLSLNMREAQLQVQCVTTQGIPVLIQGVCIYKIADDPMSITNAARRFLGQEAKMDSNIQTLFDGHLRAIIGTLTVEELIRDRDALRDKTREAAKDEVQVLGLQIDSLQIKDIGDPTKYIENLAKPNIAKVQQAARIAQAAADQASVEAEQAADAKKAEAASLSAIQQAQFAANTAKAQAESNQQGPLAAAQAQQQVTVEQTKLAELEANRTEQQLQITVRKPADAEAYRLQRVAEGARAATIAQAEGAAQQVKLAAAADAEAKTVTGSAEGNAISARGLAEASVVKAKLVAEADGIKARADALATNQEAVIAQKLAELLPEIVAKAAEPFGHAQQLIILNGGEGLNKMIGDAIGSASSLLPMIRNAFKPEDKT